MSISPFNARPAPAPGGPSRIAQGRPRLALIIATVGIAATLLAYAISPGVRHAVSHATHSVKHAMGNVLDHDATKRAHPVTPPQGAHPAAPKAPATSGTSR
ncbi:MAG TPA: hypothetical protein VNY34_01900 [Solirubrobacteraceae bacterium]|jgi:hypothetical protein|nr:hypothetical protein [Solirubrobacteraceae bacterium]